ncbi:MAG: hypothetical protein ABFR36_08265 [Acidobacteriota bacterium]
MTITREIPDSGSDHDYIFSLIDYLFFRHGINFFITSKDFDTLYNWWEKNIPEELIRKSIDNVVKRRIARGKPVDSFMNFTYEVRKNLMTKFDLNINSVSGQVNIDPEEKLSRFFENLSPDIKFLEKDFRRAGESSPKKKKELLSKIYDRLINKYEHDEEMIIKTEIFMSNLPEAMKKPDIVRKFRVNFINKRFNIPDFEEIDEK